MNLNHGTVPNERKPCENGPVETLSKRYRARSSCVYDLASYVKFHHRTVRGNPMRSQDVAIVEVAEIRNELKSGKTFYDLAGEVFSELMEKTGLRPTDIGGLSINMPLTESNPFLINVVCEAFGVSPTWVLLSAMGGCSTSGGLARAASAIRDGYCEIAVVMGADCPTTKPRFPQGGYKAEYEDPIGIQGPSGSFGLLMSRYIEQYEFIPEALGKLAIAEREHALHNEKALAKLRVPITMEDYLDSRMISDPLRLFDCVMRCDGANAMLVMSSEKARKMGFKKFAHPVAYAELSNYLGHLSQPDITETGFADIGPLALKKAGMTPKDIRIFAPYDDFTVAMLLQLEQIGFCERGQGCRYIMETDFSWKGDLPLNTSGGQISAGQPGLAGSGVVMVEAVRQLLEQGGHCQVENPRNAMVTGIGGIPYGRNWSVSSITLLEQGH